MSLIFDFNKVRLLKSKIRDTNKLLAFLLKKDQEDKGHKKHRTQKAYCSFIFAASKDRKIIKNKVSSKNHIIFVKKAKKHKNIIIKLRR